LPDRLLLACRTGCCRTTLAAGTSSWGSGSGFARPSRSSPRFSVPFCPVAELDAAGAGRDAVPGRALLFRDEPVWAEPVWAEPVRAEADAVPSFARAEADPLADVRPLVAVLVRALAWPEPFRAPAPAVLAAPEAGRAEL